MKLSVSNIAWNSQNDSSVYHMLNQFGYTGLEIAPTRIFANEPYNHLDDAVSFKNMLLNHYHLEVSSIQSIWYGKNDQIFLSYESRKYLYSYTKKAILFAQALNCKNIVFGCPKNRNLVREDDYYKIALPFFRSIADFAQQHQTVVSMEANPKIYHTNFINNNMDAVRFAREVNHPGLKVNLDIGTLLCNDENLDELMDNLDFIHHIHISEPWLEKIIKRKIHFQLKEYLADKLYDFYVSVEMKGPLLLEEIEAVLWYIREVFL